MVYYGRFINGKVVLDDKEVVLPEGATVWVRVLKAKKKRPAGEKKAGRSPKVQK